MPDQHTPVLIVGGGVTGLSAALFLARHGVPCTLVERHPDVLPHPRARGLTPRTMEAYRQCGLEQALRAASYAGPDFAWRPVKADTLADDAYEVPEEPGEDDGSAASPTGFCPVDQDVVERIVRAKARKAGAVLRYGVELDSFEQDGGGVTAVLADRSSGAEQVLRADYLVAADGIHSGVRQRLGIATEGPGTLYDTLTALVDADLAPALRGRAVSMAYLQRPRPFTILMPHDTEGRKWVFGTGYDPAQESTTDYTDQRVAEMVREAAGLPGAQVALRPQIPGTDRTVLGFPIAAQIATEYRKGRVFLVGDAAHVWPPTGGLGANAGIQDAHNLAWKLAAVIAGEAGAALLDTYHDERRSVGTATMRQAMALFGSRMGPGADEAALDYAAVSLGYRYRSAAVVGAPADAAPVPPHLLEGAPGSRAPHVTAYRNGTVMSTLDLYGAGFVLLAGPQGAAWTKAAAGRGLAAHRFGADLSDASAEHGIGAEGALLVRPDGFVAWRSRAGSRDPAADLDRVLDQVLAR
ncbi:FAD-dependent oxidoreductase [Streptomonospora sp. PA3]|uniref:FAD-dependent oxidoreductase n=1 Tax=Streptomonospora sp. PA3 TaxID=2607326 RepID=UPI0012DD6637|nr:FAD-dependent oxidoreductase [Streptomonospora sp. PA3]MUL44286.1 FAD-dependent oxidoreductase [Streptomonospora sp. PA3]